MKKIYRLLSIITLLIIVSCGSLEPQYLDEDRIYESPQDSKQLDKRIYLIGDAGLPATEEKSEALKAFTNQIESRDTSEDYLLFLGDNIYPDGLPKKDEEGREEAERMLDVQIDAAKKFGGKTIFIPGNHDWYSDGLKGLKRQEEYVEKALDDGGAFQPDNGCPIETISVSEDIELIILDTQWYIVNWDKHPLINDECDIKSREDFFLEIESELKKNNEKTVVISMHHPAYTYGLHGGYYNFQNHIFSTENKIPLPIIASLVTQVRSQGGVSPQDRYNVRYNELMRRLVTLVKDNDRVVLTSGHEHTLQYNEVDGIKQIVSGAGSKKAPVALGKGAQFVYGGRGFAYLDIFKDGSSEVSFFGVEENKPKELFKSEVYPAREEYDLNQLADEFETDRLSTVYKPEVTQKSSSYEWFWGDHYRYVYGTEIKVPVITLDTLMGGMNIERKGGGHQTRSLRLNDPNGRNFALRAVDKSAIQFLQAVAFKDTYVQEDFENTVTEEAVKDFYTSSHPYAAFVVGPLSDAIGLYHTNPKLFYMPKHKALGKYNVDYGDELYIMEERPDDGFLDVESFGKPDAIESTSDVLENLRKDEEYQMDEAAFIKARLFDMLVGDWDRHQDQWRWSRFDISKDKKIYRPIPRDRDQVFSNYDGALFDVLKFILPASRQFQEFREVQKDVRWINLAGIKIDRTFTQNSGKEVWIEQAKFIQENMTDAIIDRAFKNLPPEVQDETAADIASKLKTRRSILVELAERYHDYLNDLVIITGTDKDDYLEVKRDGDKTTVSISRKKDGKVQTPFKQRTIDHKETKEVWIYALDDDDEVHVIGEGKNLVKVRIIGGQNNDSYTIKNGKKINVYDHKTKPNEIKEKGGAKFRFEDNYRYNTYQYDKYISSVTNILPSLGFNPDDGMILGLSFATAKKGFRDSPQQSRHTLKGGYFFATQGFDLHYRGEFATFMTNWQILAEARLTTENYAENFFGFGNETENLDDDLGLDYNRVKHSVRMVKAGVVRNGDYGSRLEISGGVESIKVQDTPGRFIETVITDPTFFDNAKIFGSAGIKYEYSGFDNSVSPTRGMFFELTTGVTTNLEAADRTFGFINPSMQFYNTLGRSRRLILRTQVQGEFNIGQNFEFYQAATLGASNGLRGFREERFSGNSALAFNGDLRYHLADFKTGLLPIEMGIYGGGDVGRVWVKGESSDKWHNSYGGGLWINAVDAVGLNVGLFGSADGSRFSFQFVVKF